MKPPYYIDTNHGHLVVTLPKLNDCETCNPGRYEKSANHHWTCKRVLSDGKVDTVCDRHHKTLDTAKACAQSFSCSVYRPDGKTEEVHIFDQDGKQITRFVPEDASIRGSGCVELRKQWVEAPIQPTPEIPE